MRQQPWGDLIMAAVITRHTEPTIKAANAYLVNRGYINYGTTWLRGKNEYARMERLTSGPIRIVEGVA